MIQEFDRVALNVDLPGLGLKTGDVGVVVHVFGQGAGYIVEFLTLLGETIGTESLEANAVRSLRADEIPAARIVEPLAS